jgi:hypothetical protein
MDVNNLTKVGYVIDTSTSKWNDPTFNPDILSTGMRNHTSDSIFNFQFMLAYVLTFALNGAQFFVQSNEVSML